MTHISDDIGEPAIEGEPAFAIDGVEGIESRLIVASRSLGARPWTIFREVIFPGALPSIITGLSIGMGTSWFCLVTAEMIAGLHAILEGKVRIQCHVTFTKRVFRELGRLVDRAPMVAFLTLMGLMATVVLTGIQGARLLVH